jgi:hypothetical protein
MGGMGRGGGLRLLNDCGLFSCAGYCIDFAVHQVCAHPYFFTPLPSFLPGELHLTISLCFSLTSSVSICLYCTPWPYNTPCTIHPILIIFVFALFLATYIVGVAFAHIVVASIVLEEICDG